jgi:hypothetical protein
MTGTLPDGRFRWATPTTAAWVGGASALLVAATLLLSLLNYRLAGSSNGASYVISLGFTAVGVLVARRQPRNVVGWLLIGFGLTSQISSIAVLLITFDDHVWHGPLLIARLALFGEGTLWDLPILLFLPAVLLFPDGHTHSSRWRLILWTYWCLCALILVSQGVATAFVLSARVVAVSSAGNVTVIPTPKEYFAGVVGSGLIVLTLVPFLALAIVHQASRFRRASGDVRQQIKWFTAGTAVALLGLVVTTIAGAQPQVTVLTSVVASVATYVTISFPLGIGFGMLKYRLYDVDRLISRTLSYAIVTGLLVGIYVGLVTLATRVLPFSSPLGVAASTLAAVGLFNPLRRRVQRLVDHRFNRARYDAEATVTAFAARLREAVDLETVGSDLLAVVGDSFEPSHMSLWLPGSALGGEQRPAR